MLLRSIATLLIFAAPLLPQQKQGPDIKAATGEKSAEGVEVADDGSVAAKGGIGAVAEPVAPAVRSARGQCYFVTATVPMKVAPGTNGTLVVMMVLEGDAVLTSPPPLTFDFAAEQGPILLGSPQARPAKMATLAKAFQGRMVYDNIAFFDIPFSVQAGTPFGQKQTVSVGLDFDLHYGGNGQAIGRFSDRASHLIEIGLPEQPVSTSILGVDASSAGSVSQQARDPSTPVAASGSAERAPIEVAPWVQAPRPEAPVPPDPAATADTLEPSEQPVPPARESGLLWLTVAAGCALLAVVVLLRSKR